MELHKALRHIIQTEGEGIVTETRLVNILDDFQAYADMPTAKYILRAIISDGYADKLLKVGEWNNEAKNLASHFSQSTGYMPDAVNTLFQSLAYGLGWVRRLTASSSPNSSSTPLSLALAPSKIKPTGPRSNGWSKTMNEDETDEFFQRITEYDKSTEAQFQVKLENLYYFVEDDKLCFSCEMKRKFRREKSITLNVALYNAKGKVVTSSWVSYVDQDTPNPKPVVKMTDKKASNIGKVRIYWS